MAWDNVSCRKRNLPHLQIQSDILTSRLLLAGFFCLRASPTNLLPSKEQFAQHIENVVKNPTSTKELTNGRSAYWDQSSGTVVIRNPKAADGGTAFRPTNGRAYFDNLR